MKSRFLPRVLAAITGVGFATVAVVSQAAVTAAQLTPISDDVGDSVEALMPYAIGMLAVVLGASIAIKLVKKFSNKAT